MSIGVRNKGGDASKQEKIVTAGTAPIEVTPDKGKLLSRVTVNPTPTEERTVTPLDTEQVLTPTSGKYLSKVTINAVPKQLAPFNACPDFDADNCEIGTMLCNALTYPSRYPSQTYMHLKITHALGKAVTFAVASNATKYTNSNGGFLGLNVLYQKSCGRIATHVYNGSTYASCSRASAGASPYDNDVSDQGTPQNSETETWLGLGGSGGVPTDWNSHQYAYLISAK